MISPNYFDYAAATPLDPKVLAVMVPYFGDNFFNPSAEYLGAKQVAGDIKQARQKIANCLGVRTSEIIFTAGGTEANNLAIHGILSSYPKANIVTSSIEHDSVIAPASQHPCSLVSVDTNGYIDLTSLENSINDNTVLVSIMYANNEVGTVQPVQHVADIVTRIKKVRSKIGNTLPLYLHTDASQAGNYLSLKVDSLGVDMMTINGGKIYGPKQSGALFLRSGIQLVPQVLGGGQENGYRSGTENVANIVGLAEAVHIAQDLRSTELKRMQGLQEECVKLLTQKIPSVVINGGKKRLPNIVHFTIPGIDNETVMMRLDEKGFQVAVGSACSASSDEPSHVLTAMGIDAITAQSSLRISMGRFTTPDALGELIKALVKSL